MTYCVTEHILPINIRDKAYNPSVLIEDKV